MPLIKLKNPRGIYGWAGQTFEGGKVYEVDNRTAYYLVNDTKIAEEVNPQYKDQMEAEEKSKKIKQFEDKNLIKIAMVRLGGLGDSLILGAHAKAVKKKYPNSQISLYIREKNDLLTDLPHVARTVCCGNVNWKHLVDGLIKEKRYDLIFDNRYITKVYFKDLEKMAEPFKKDCAEYDRHFAKYREYYDGWIASNKNIEKLGCSTFELFYRSTGLEGGEDDLQIVLAREHFKITKLIEDTPYVTVHNGSDQARQTKCYPTKNWIDVVIGLKKRGFKVIQLGNTYEDTIEGASNLCGMTSIFETAALIKKAQFHVDSEGGLVHVARAVGTRSVVVFGPTPIKCFAYDSNVNIESPEKCKGCWWTTEMWWRDCPKGFFEPIPCMANITPDEVLKACDKIKSLPKIKLADGSAPYDPDDVNEQFAMELQLNEGHYRAEKHQWERINAMMDQVKGPKVLEVGAGDGYCVLVMKKRGFDVTATEISEIRIQRMKESGIEPIKADVRQLPFPDSSFDTVMCGEVLEHIPNMWQGLKELERVCKPNGKIIFSLPLHQRYDGIKMHLWGVRFHPIMFDGHIDLGVFEMTKINQDQLKKEASNV
jgi:ADP-heptose:LPS heptosyltransferase/ubiquinone/menaquinone biosynthesis C-methylase UbiE